MAIQHRFCANHPQRPAIGVCVMTGKAICGECSTRYEGVNYSREGLELLQKQRASAAGRRQRWKERAAGLLVWGGSPLLVYLMYLGFLTLANLLTTLLHKGVS